ncbi:MAG TPA: hypothetical protein VHE35_03385 [Kofleriaceae bacterium]|nr:hypothetical protein [Kofleriaceae bacterium]
MTTLDDYVRRIPGFTDLGHTDKIRFFAWYVHDVEGKEFFEQADITACFKKLGMERPGSLGSYMASLASRTPPEVLRGRKGYQLEHRARQRLSDSYSARPATVEVHKVLGELPMKLSNPVEQAFLEETLLCFKVGAFRAAVVMCWNLTYEHMCDYVLASRLADFNTKLRLAFPRARPIAGRDDFAELKESQMLEVCRGAGITTPSVNRLLGEKLARRNAAAHPSGVVVTQVSAEEMILDLVTNVVLKY